MAETRLPKIVIVFNSAASLATVRTRADTILTDLKQRIQTRLGDKAALLDGKRTLIRRGDGIYEMYLKLWLTQEFDISDARMDGYVDDIATWLVAQAQAAGATNVTAVTQ